MKREEVFNFSAGPSVLPKEVLDKAAAELLNYNGTGISVMEMSHRSKIFLEIFHATKSKLKAILEVPDTHEILFLQGGATAQFSAVPLNLMGTKTCADYVITGNFAQTAAKEARKYGQVHIAASSEDRNHTYIPAQKDIQLSSDPAYLYYCANNTVFGTEWSYIPESGAVPLVCDMSSNILSRPIEISRYGLIFAGAQKNMAPAGLTVVIVQKSLVGQEMPMIPSILSYDKMIQADSMLNTPPCYNIYMLGLMLDWIGSQGGVIEMERRKKARAKLLYDYLDESKFYIPCAEKDARSEMNVTFRTASKELDAEFSSAAEQNGLLNLKGHRAVGGMRASLYNAMPMEGVSALIEFMKEFEAKYHV